jgi:uncharacterized tellurite resistance protein B-like protein
MLDRLRLFIDRLLPPSAAAAKPDEHVLQLAAAVLLVEVMRADTHIGQAERDAVNAALREKFGLTEEESRELSALARQTAHQATDFHAYTSVLNERLDLPQRIRLIELMWKVAYADGQLADHERHLLWRVGDLLHVPQGARVHARLRAAGTPDPHS